MEVSKPQDGGRREGSFRERPERQWGHAHAFGYYLKEEDRKVKGKCSSHLLEEVLYLTKEIISLLFSLACLQESQISWGS